MKQLGTHREPLRNKVTVLMWKVFFSIKIVRRQSLSPVVTGWTEHKSTSKHTYKHNELKLYVEFWRNTRPVFWMSGSVPTSQGFTTAIIKNNSFSLRTNTIVFIRKVNRNYHKVIEFLSNTILLAPVELWSTGASAEAVDVSTAVMHEVTQLDKGNHCRPSHQSRSAVLLMANSFL